LRSNKPGTDLQLKVTNFAGFTVLAQAQLLK